MSNDAIERILIEKKFESACIGLLHMPLPRMMCRDGFSMSVQFGIAKNALAPRASYISASHSDIHSVEIGFCKMRGEPFEESLLSEYERDGDVFYFVDLQVVVDLLEKHKGFVGWACGMHDLFLPQRCNSCDCIPHRPTISDDDLTWCDNCYRDYLHDYGI